MALADLPPDHLQRRPVPGMWSIAEYTDHVREVLFGMRFVLDSAVAEPGVDLGNPPKPPVDAHWIARHAVHDATHHLLDVEGLRSTQC